MKTKLKSWLHASWLHAQRIRLLHRLLQDEMRRQGWKPDLTTAGERWEKVETYELSPGHTGSFTNNMAYHEAVSKTLKGLPR